MIATDERTAIWHTFGASDDVAAELLAYTDGGAADPRCPAECPLADEPLADAWQRYSDDAAGDGVAAVLHRVFVQLHFPVAAGISETEPYRAATRRGSSATLLSDSPFVRPDAATLLHPTAAGRIPSSSPEARRLRVTRQAPHVQE